MNIPELLSASEVAEILGVNRQQIYQWRYNKSAPIKSARIAGKVKFRKSDIEEFLATAFAN